MKDRADASLVTALEAACTKRTTSAMRDFIVELLLWSGAALHGAEKLIRSTRDALNLGTAGILEQWAWDGKGKGPFCRSSCHGFESLA